jgi:hypothetical protein
MKRETVRQCFLGVLFLSAVSVAPAQTSNIPQIVDGGPWLTTIAVTNTGSSQEIVSLSFFQETGGGNTATWNLAFEEGSAQGLLLPPASTMFLHTFGTAANTTIGWGQLNEFDATGVVQAYAIFTQRVPNRSDQDGTAPAASSVSRILVPFDNTNGAVTSMAIANTTTTSETINVGVRISSGISQPAAITLPANGHASFAFPTQFTATANQSGLAEFYAPSGSFSILALKFNSGAFTTAPVYSPSGPPIIASSGSGGGSTSGNIIMGGFSAAKFNTTSGSFPSTGTTDELGGQFASYTPAEWQVPFAAPTFGPCSVLSVSNPVGGKGSYTADTYLDAGTITLTGTGLPQGGVPLSTTQFTVGGLFYFYAPAAGSSLAYGGTYTISSNGGTQVGPFSVSATLPTSFSVTNWDAITTVNRANGLTVNWTGSGFDTVVIDLSSSTETATTVSGVTVACEVPASSGTFTVPAAALALLPAGSAQFDATATTGGGGTATAVSSTSRELVPNLVGGGQVNYGFFAPSLAAIKTVTVQ